MLLPPDRTFLLRHGRYDPSTGSIDRQGKTDAERAVSELHARGIGEKAVILSSTSRRARETAEEVSAGLGASGIRLLGLLEDYGNYPAKLEDFDTAVQAALEEQNPPITQQQLDNGLVIVTHGPLVAAAQNHWRVRSNDLNELAPHGQVINYVPGSWDNPFSRL